MFQITVQLVARHVQTLVSSSYHCHHVLENNLFSSSLVVIHSLEQAIDVSEWYGLVRTTVIPVDDDQGYQEDHPVVCAR